MIRDAGELMTIRHLSVATAALAIICALPQAASAQAKKKTAEPAAASGPKKVETYGKWDVYVQSGKTKLCYALSRPQKRAPTSLKRDDGYIFISSRPAQNVRNEVAVKMGYDVKEDSKPRAEIGSTRFEMVPNGGDLFVRNAAEERPFVAALRKGSSLVVHASSKRGNDTVDTFALTGIGQALDRLAKECQ